MWRIVERHSDTLREVMRGLERMGEEVTFGVTPLGLVVSNDVYAFDLPKALFEAFECRGLSCLELGPALCGILAYQSEAPTRFELNHHAGSIESNYIAGDRRGSMGVYEARDLFPLQFDAPGESMDDDPMSEGAGEARENKNPPAGKTEEV